MLFEKLIQLFSSCFPLSFHFLIFFPGFVDHCKLVSVKVQLSNSEMGCFFITHTQVDKTHFNEYPSITHTYPTPPQVSLSQVGMHVECLQSKSIKQPYKEGCLICFLVLGFFFPLLNTSLKASFSAPALGKCCFIIPIQ